MRFRDEPYDQHVLAGPVTAVSLVSPGLDAGAECARRKAIVEPPFGQIKLCRGLRQFLLRSLENMQGEWKLVRLPHKLLKLFRSGACAVS